MAKNALLLALIYLHSYLSEIKTLRIMEAEKACHDLHSY